MLLPECCLKFNFVGWCPGILLKPVLSSPDALVSGSVVHFHGQFFGSNSNFRPPVNGQFRVLHRGLLIPSAEAYQGKSPPWLRTSSCCTRAMPGRTPAKPPWSSSTARRSSCCNKRRIVLIWPPATFIYFAQLKSRLARKTFATENELELIVQGFVRDKESEGFYQAFQKLYKLLLRVIQVEGGTLKNIF